MCRFKKRLALKRFRDCVHSIRQMATSSNRRVLVVEPAGNLWGSERALLDLCSGLSSNGWRLALCCPPNTPILQLADASFNAVFPTFIANLHRKPKWKRGIAMLQLIRAVRKFKPDLIYVNQAGATKLALGATTVSRQNLVTHTRIREDVDYLIPMISHARVGHVLCVSDYIRDCYKSKIGVDNLARITSIHDCYQRTQSEPNVQSVYQNRVICAGRIETNKGQDLLVAALDNLRDRMPELQVLLLGTFVESDFTSRLLSDVERLDMVDRIEMVGFIGDIWPHMKSADFLVCPSHVEALGRVIFEAWDVGIVPIAYAGSGGPAETIRAADAGILYDHQDPLCLSDAISAAYALPLDKRIEMIQRGRSWMNGNLDPMVSAKKVSDIFDSVITGSKIERSTV